jgi:hypothetical protein
MYRALFGWIDTKVKVGGGEAASLRAFPCEGQAGAQSRRVHAPTSGGALSVGLHFDGNPFQPDRSMARSSCPTLQWCCAS